MKDHIDTLALLLAAEQHPHLKDQPEYREAKQKLEESASLQADFADSKAFFEVHPVLVGVDRMPTDTRARIESALRREMGEDSDRSKRPELTPWTIRTQFAWAAVLVLLLAGMAVLSTSIINQQERRQRRIARSTLPPLQAFQSFVADTVQQRIPLQERDPDASQLIAWLREQGASPLNVPADLANNETLGCAYFDGPHGKISLLCFGADEQVVHLFITPSRTLNLSAARSPRAFELRNRAAVQWNDTENAYLLIAHNPNTPLPERFLPHDTSRVPPTSSQRHLLASL